MDQSGIRGYATGSPVQGQGPERSESKHRYVSETITEMLLDYELQCSHPYAIAITDRKHELSRGPAARLFFQRDQFFMGFL